MSPDKAKRLLAIAKNLKVRVLLSLAYVYGLRTGEMARLEAGDDHSVDGWYKANHVVYGGL